MDNEQRIALVRLGAAHPEDMGPAVQFQLGDHLGSSHAVVDSAGRWSIAKNSRPMEKPVLGALQGSDTDLLGWSGMRKAG